MNSTARQVIDAIIVGKKARLACASELLKEDRSSVVTVEIKLLAAEILGLEDERNRLA